MSGELVLWFTKELPYPPNFGGDILYSKVLTEVFSGISNLKVFTFEPAKGVASKVPDGTLLQPRRKRSAILSIFSSLPWYAYRYNEPSFQRRVRALAHQNPIVVIDSLALYPVAVEAKRLGLRFVYVSHNYEGPMRLEIAKVSASGLKRFLSILDARKAAKAEKFLIKNGSIVTTITDEDAAAIRKDYPDARAITVPMAYTGVSSPSSALPSGNEAPILIAGSFHWIAKQINLRRFLRETNRLLETGYLTIRIVGSMPDDFRSELESTYRGLDIRSDVHNIYEHFEGCRLGMIIDELGGGFKIKTLDYGFNHIPIAAYPESMAGTGMAANVHYAPIDPSEECGYQLERILGSEGKLVSLASNARSLVEAKFNGDLTLERARKALQLVSEQVG